MTTTDEPTMRLTDEARALADAQPVIDIHEAPSGDGPSTAIATTGTTTVHEHGERERSALDAAAEAALLMPGIAGRDEFLALAMQARILSLSPAVPKALQNNPHLCLHVAMIGRDLGISASAATELIDVIPGYGDKPPQLSLSPQLLNAQLQRLRLGTLRRVVYEYDRCLVEAVAPDGTILGESEFTWEDARIAGLVGPNCEPGAHVNKPNSNRCGCNQGYITYPRRMMWQRASGFAADDFFPQAGLGLYSPEALGANVDRDGRLIDPATVELPEGYEAAEKGPTAAERAAAPAPEIDVIAIKAKIETLPPPARDALAALWSEPTGETTPAGLPIPRLWPMRTLPAGQVKTAHALVDSVVKRAEKGEWGEWVGHGTGEAPTDAQDPPESDPAADAPNTSPDDVVGDEDETCGANDGLCDELAVVLDDDGNPYCATHAPEGLIP